MLSNDAPKRFSINKNVELIEGRINYTNTSTLRQFNSDTVAYQSNSNLLATADFDNEPDESESKIENGQT